MHQGAVVPQDVDAAVATVQTMVADELQVRGQIPSSISVLEETWRSIQSRAHDAHRPHLRRYTLFQTIPL